VATLIRHELTKLAREMGLDAIRMRTLDFIDVGSTLAGTTDACFSQNLAYRKFYLIPRRSAAHRSDFPNQRGSRKSCPLRGFLPATRDHPGRTADRAHTAGVTVLTRGRHNPPWSKIG